MPWNPFSRRSLAAALERNTSTLVAVLQELKRMSQAMDELTAAVNAEETVQAQILTYLQGVPGLITAAVNAGNTDATAMTALANQIGADTAKLAAGLNAAPPEGVQPAGNVTSTATPAVDVTAPTPAPTPATDTPPADPTEPPVS